MFINPKEEKHTTPLPTYEDAQKEIAENSGLSKLAGKGKSQGEC